MTLEIQQQIDEKFTIVTVYIPPGKTLSDAIVHTYGEFPSRSKGQTALRRHTREHERYNGPTPKGGLLIRKVVRMLPDER